MGRKAKRRMGSSSELAEVFLVICYLRSLSQTTNSSTPTRIGPTHSSFFFKQLSAKFCEDLFIFYSPSKLRVIIKLSSTRVLCLLRPLDSLLMPGIYYANLDFVNVSRPYEQPLPRSQILLRPFQGVPWNDQSSLFISLSCE
jgi:hypothetical protein